jgi:hypothetical protein
VTEAWAFGQRPLPADVLVDARGWGPLALPGFPPWAADAVTLVDAGVSGAVGARLAATRLADYRRRGWAVAERAR